MTTPANTRLIVTALNLIENAQQTYKSRNGRQCFIEMEDGEMGMLVHSDDLHALNLAAQAVMEQPGPEEEIKAAISSATGEAIRTLQAHGIIVGPYNPFTMVLKAIPCGAKMKRKTPEPS